jgi:putative membrane protein
VERTYLAWLRTGLALMGFGFVVARFGLLMREIAHISKVPSHATGLSTHYGSALIILGILLTAGSIWRYQYTLRRLERGEVLYKPSIMALAFGVILSVIGIVVAIQLLFIE